VISLIDGDVLLYASIWGSEGLLEAQENFDKKLQENLEACWTDKYAMALGGPNNFRITLYPDYKRSKSRVKSSSNKPEWFDMLKAYAHHKHEGVICDGYEADDQLRIWANECNESEYDYIVDSIDKDLNCIVGKHYNSRKGLIYEVTEQYAERFYWTQLLMGDTVDNIPGIEGIGPKKAENLLAGYSQKQDYKRIVSNAYNNKYPDDGYERMLLNGKLLHLWRDYEDHFSFSREEFNAAL